MLQIINAIMKDKNDPTTVRLLFANQTEVIFADVYIYVCIYAYTCKSCTCIYIYVYSYTYIYYIYIHISICIYVYIYIYTAYPAAATWGLCWGVDHIYMHDPNDLLDACSASLRAPA